MSGYGPGWKSLQISSPNVSGLMAQVRGGINDAAGAAESILGRYQEGQELKAENELIRRIGGMDQAQLRDAFNNGKFDDLNLGAKGVELLNKAMGQRADIRSTNVSTDKTQASIGWGNDANSRANSAAGREATRFDWATDDRQDNLARRNALRKFAPDHIAAEERAFRQGTPAATGTTGNSGRLNVFAGTRADLRGTAERPNISLDFNAVEGGGARGTEVIIPDNASPEVRAAAEQYNQRVAEFAAANGIEGYNVRGVRTRSENGRGVSNTIHLEPFFNDDVAMQEAIKNDPEGWARIHQDTFGGLNANLVAPHGVNGDKGAASDIFGSETDYGMMVINALLGQGPTPPEPENQAQAQAAQDAAAIVQESQNPNAGGFQPTPISRGGGEYARRLAETGLFTGQEVLGQIAPIREAATAGQAVRDQQLTEFQNDVLSGVVDEVVASPDAMVISEAEDLIRQELLEQGNFSQAEADQFTQKAIDLINSSPSRQTELAGGELAAGVKGSIEESASNTIDAARRALMGQDQARALSDIPRFTEDPTGNLESDLGIPNDPETRGDYRSEFLRRHINNLADKFDVEPAVMAVAMRDAFIPDPGEANEGRWWDIDWTRNTIENRFDEDIIAQTIQQLSPERQADFARQESNLTIRTNQLNQNTQQQLIVERRLKKALQQGDMATAERMEARLQALRAQAAQISTQEILQSSRQ